MRPTFSCVMQRHGKRGTGEADGPGSNHEDAVLDAYGGRGASNSVKRRFILVDHSLSRVGGHEFDYAVNVLQAAEAAGYTVVLAANRRFGGGCGLPDHWPVFPLFPHTAYSKHCVSMGGHRHLPLGWDGRRLPGDDEGGAPPRPG